MNLRSVRSSSPAATLSNAAGRGPVEPGHINNRPAQLLHETFKQSQDLFSRLLALRTKPGATSPRLVM